MPGDGQGASLSNSSGSATSAGVPAINETVASIDATTRVRFARADLVWALAVAVDASAGNYFVLSATSNIAAVVQVPTNAPATPLSQRITFEVRNNSGGALTTQPTFIGGAGGFVVLGALPAIANGLRYTVSFVWNPSAGVWVQDGPPSAAG